MLSAEKGWWAVVCLILLCPSCLAWGPDAHDAVTRAAISVLPAELHPFYARNERLIVGLDNLPDMWRDTHRKAEGPHHYVDLDLLSKPPFGDIPRSYAAAERKYGRAKLLQVGVLPWSIQGRHQKLVSAMRRRDFEGIVVHSAILSHYVADGANPLHTTSEYDGRTPEQKGIHGRFEMEVADRLMSGWRLRPPDLSDKSDRPDRSDAILRYLASSFAQVEAVYQADAAASKADPSRGEVYGRVFQERAAPLAKSRLEAASSFLADLYYTAWVSAGKPNLPATAAPLFWGR